MPAWNVSRTEERIIVGGELRFADARAIWARLHAVAARPPATLDIDLTTTKEIDGSIMALLLEIRRELHAQAVRCEIIVGDPRLRAAVRLFHGDVRDARRPRRRGISPIARLGLATHSVLERGYTLVSFAGELVATLGRLARRKATFDVRSLPVLIARAGTDGILIVVVLNFLVGFVMAYQSSRQLELYGANIYVADIVGISITRELAPLMTAIILSGRSGAGFAAELGTMRVSDEIDALRTMGFTPVAFLVLPRIVALALVAPVLTLLGDVVGLAGGIVVAQSALDVTPTGFLIELRSVLLPSDVWTGLVKSVAFALAIAFIGCQQGLAARGAASGVGRSTTSTVVYCLFAIVVIDTLATIVFRGVGL